MGSSYVALLAVKPPGRGKSRLGDLPRDVLAAAFATDAAMACLAAPSIGQVLVVTDDASFAGTLSRLGCAKEAARRWPELVPLAMCADLPCLTAGQLEEALSQKPGRPRFVTDASGSGTTLYTAPLEDFAPRFGPRSASLHEQAGAWPLEGALPGLRQDVDDAGDLEAAVTLGLGPHTARAVARIR
jgi:2-phospho-L-lactate/phosphoenolpyruvate guanylyltransferase